MGEIIVEKTALQPPEGRSPGRSRFEVHEDGWAGGGNCECPAHRGEPLPCPRENVLSEQRLDKWAEDCRGGNFSKTTGSEGKRRGSGWSKA